MKFLKAILFTLLITAAAHGQVVQPLGGQIYVDGELVAGAGAIDATGDLTQFTGLTGTNGQVFVAQGDGTGAWEDQSGSGGGGTWGTIVGTLSSQTDLWTELTNRYTKAEIDGFGFLTSESDPVWTAASNLYALIDGVGGWTNLSQYNNDSGFLTAIPAALNNLTVTNLSLGGVSAQAALYVDATGKITPFAASGSPYSELVDIDGTSVLAPIFSDVTMSAQASGGADFAQDSHILTMRTLWATSVPLANGNEGAEYLVANNNSNANYTVTWRDADTDVPFFEIWYDGTILGQPTITNIADAANEIVNYAAMTGMGYLTAETDPVWTAASNLYALIDGVGGWTNLSEYNNDAGFLVTGDPGAWTNISDYNYDIVNNTVTTNFSNPVYFPSIYINGTLIDGSTSSVSIANVAFDADFIPTVSNSFDIGSAEFPVATIYVNTGTVVFVGGPEPVGMRVDTNGQISTSVGTNTPVDYATEAYVADYIAESNTTTEVVLYSTAHDHINSVQDVVNHVWSSGACGTGFDLTENGDGSIDIDGGSAVVRAENTPHGSLKGYAVAGVTNMVMTNNAMNYILVDYNAGSPELINTTDLNTVLTDRTKVIVYAVNRLDNELYVADFRSLNVDFQRKSNIKDYLKYGIEHASGNVISHTTNLQFAVTAGTYYVLNVPQSMPAIDLSDTNTVQLVYRDGVGGWTRVTTNTLNLTYDDGDGTPAAIDNHYLGEFWVFAVNNDPGEYKVLYGQAQYATLAEAQASTVPASLPSDLDSASTAVLIGKIIVDEDAPTSFADIQTPFADTLASSVAANHNELAGLQGGDVNDYQHLTTAQAGLVDTAVQPNDSPTFGTVTANLLTNSSPVEVHTTATADKDIVNYETMEAENASGIIGITNAYTATTPASFTQVTNWLTTGNSKLTTLTKTGIVCQVSGRYDIDAKISNSGLSGATHDFQLQKNGVAILFGTQPRKLGSTDVGSIAVGAQISLVSNDVVNLAVRASTGNVVIEKGNLRLTRIGD